MIQPPIVGRTVGATITAMPYSANACARFYGGKVSARIACSLVGMPPPPSPAGCGTPAARPGSAPGRKAGACGEQRHADHVEALAADHIGQPAAHRQHDGVGDQISGDDPGALVDAGAEAAGDVAQRDVGDRGVEHDHEGGDRDDDGDEPRVAVAGRRSAGIQPPAGSCSLIAPSPSAPPTCRVRRHVGLLVEHDLDRYALHDLDVIAGCVLGGSRLNAVPLPAWMLATWPLKVRPG